MEAVTQWLNSLPVSGTEWIFVILFVVLDVGLGTFKAWSTGTISSSIARQGVMHKMGYFGAMALCTLIDFAQEFLNLGFQTPTLTICAVMICLTEAFSVCEHIQEMNPDIDFSFLKRGE